SLEVARLHALLIGVDCYLPNQLPEGSYPSLQGCVRDVKHVADFLRRRLGVSAAQLNQLTSTNSGKPDPPEPPEQWPSYENMVRALKRLTQQAQPGDQVYIHYSGHGGRVPTILPE